jgi:hypothetical protein
MFGWENALVLYVYFLIHAYTLVGLSDIHIRAQRKHPVVRAYWFVGVLLAAEILGYSLILGHSGINLLLAFGITVIGSMCVLAPSAYLFVLHIRRKSTQLVRNLWSVYVGSMIAVVTGGLLILLVLSIVSTGMI